MKLAWFLYFGRKLGMTKREIYWTPYDEMLDMIACMAIENGAKQKKHISQEEILFDWN